MSAQPLKGAKKPGKTTAAAKTPASPAKAAGTRSPGKGAPSATTGVVPVGLIGCGNMGGALAGGILVRPALREGYPVYAYDPNPASMAAMRALGAQSCASARELAAKTSLILLAVKPGQVAEILQDIAPAIAARPGTLVVSIAAGVTLAQLSAAVGGSCPVVRVMPNTLALAGEGLFGLCFEPETLSAAQAEAVRRLFSGLGRVVELAEDKINAFTALSGCGPAYVFYFAEALVEAGVSMGLARQDSLEIALSLLRGSASLAAQSGKSPAELREQVSSPGGMTIKGLNYLDRNAVRGHVVDAVLAAWARGFAMEAGNK